MPSLFHGLMWCLLHDSLVLFSCRFPRLLQQMTARHRGQQNECLSYLVESALPSYLCNDGTYWKQRKHFLSYRPCCSYDTRPWRRGRYGTMVCDLLHWFESDSLTHCWATVGDPSIDYARIWPWLRLCLPEVVAGLEPSNQPTQPSSWSRPSSLPRIRTVLQLRRGRGGTIDPLLRNDDDEHGASRPSHQYHHPRWKKSPGLIHSTVLKVLFPLFRTI